MILNPKTNITIRLSMMNYPIQDGFLIDSRSIGWNQGSQENSYNSWTEQATKIGLSQIEREQFFLLIDKLTNRVKLRNVSRQWCWKCPSRMHLIGPLLTNHILACIDASESSLSNGENRTSLSCSYQKLFKKYSPLFYFETDNNN